MSNNRTDILPHLKNSIPKDIKGYSTGFYTIALEGWRRGLTLKFINRDRRKAVTPYELKSEKRSHIFIGSRADLIDSETLGICSDKSKTKKYLYQSNVPTPIGKRFNKNETDESILMYSESKGYPLVLKPVSGRAGQGVIANIKNKDEMAEAIGYVRGQLGYKSVIVEEYIKGDDYRVFVVDDEVVAITKRIPANIIGDGKTTIRELIKKKNEFRKNNPILSSSLIKEDRDMQRMLKKHNYTLDTIPKENETVFLKSTNNISVGGDPIDITDDVSDSIKQIAINAVNAIPKLSVAGVDLMVNSEEDRAVVLEVNTQASIRSHLFPMKGKARDVPGKIIDFYFPETKGVQSNDKVYFDFAPVWSSFQTGKVQEYTMPKIPTEIISQTRFIVNGKVKNVNYGAWVRRNARDYKLHGYLKHLKNNSAEIAILGTKADVDEFRSLIKSSNSKNSLINKVLEKELEKPIMAGFRILNPELDIKLKDGYYPVRLEGLSKIRRPLRKKRKTLKKNNRVNYEKDLNEILKSKSWRITKPLRKLRRVFKK